MKHIERTNEDQTASMPFTKVQLDPQRDYGKVERNGNMRHVDELYLNSDSLRRSAWNADYQIDQAVRHLLSAEPYLEELDKSKGYLVVANQKDGQPMIHSGDEYAQKRLGFSNRQLYVYRKASVAWRKFVERYNADLVASVPVSIELFYQLSLIPEERWSEGLNAINKEYGMDGMVGGKYLRQWRLENKVGNPVEPTEEPKDKTPSRASSNNDELGDKDDWKEVRDQTAVSVATQDSDEESVSTDDVTTQVVSDATNADKPTTTA